MVELKSQRNMIYARISKICVLLLCFGQIVTTNFIDLDEISKIYSFKVANLAEVIPGWSYYSTDDNSNPRYTITENNIVKTIDGTSCSDLKPFQIDTLNILKEDVYLKGHFRFKVLVNNNKDCYYNNLRLRRLSETYSLILSSLRKRDFYDIKLIFPKQFLLSSVNCNNIFPSQISVKTGFLELDTTLLSTKRFSNNIHCTLQATNGKQKLIKTLEIQFTSPFLVLNRKRRSTYVSFDENPYYVQVKESVDEGESIITLKANGGSGSYKYTKNRDSKTDRYFKLNPNTGELTVQEKLNREGDATRFTIDIAATDVNNANLIGRTSVEIEVLDVNDNAPIFEQPAYSKSVKEEQSPRFIISVVAKDADIKENAKITYSIVKDSNDVECPFKIDPMLGEISNTELLDREKQPYYVLKVKAEDHGADPGPLSSIVNVNITLIDINDNKPVFTNNTYSVTIPESTKKNVVILTVSATDKDSGSNSKIRYSAINDAPFIMNEETGEIRLKEQLDYDSYQRFYSLHVTAFDNGSPFEFSTTQVEVTVSDVNDNIPKFTRKEFLSSRPILEDTPIGTVVFKLSARDRDSGDSGKITFSFDDDIPSTFPFSLKSDTGEIKLEKKLDYEVQQEYKFGVIAKDNGDSPLTDTATVTLEIGNINDNPPMFKNSTYRLEISEDTRKGAAILTVSATDPDHLSSGDNFEYAIVEGDVSGCFSMDAYSGTILLRNCLLDVKKKKEYKLKLRVTDEDNKEGFAWLIITIFDANNNAPRFTSNVNTLTVREDVPSGSPIGSVEATDEDSGENARITYSLVQPNEVFELDPDNGQIKTKQGLDREKRVSYQFLIKAQDHGKPYPKSSTSTLVVKILDVNDEKPVFSKTSYSFNVLEDISVGSFVGKVIASDDDEGLNKEIIYKLQDDANGHFEIGQANGLIRTSKLLDREQVASYKLTVIAVDQGFKVQLNSTVDVFITVDDVPDSAPEFKQSIYDFYIKENDVGLVGQVRATLNDSLEHQNNLIYSIKDFDPKSPFSINRRDGSLRTTRPLDFEERQNYTIGVRVKAPSQISAYATVNVYVQDINDNPPELEDFYIFLNVLGGDFNPVFKVPAQDKDVTSKLRYFILSGNEREYVKLNETSGELELLKSILNTPDEAAITFKVHDGNAAAQAVGRIAVSEVTPEMVDNSMFIVLNNVTRDMFLRTQVLKKFKRALATAFRCDSRRIFILSIRDFHDVLEPEQEGLPKLEVAIAVREQTTDRFMASSKLKDSLYLNKERFEAILEINMISFDFWTEFFCGVEPCSNFKQCSMNVISNDTQAQEGSIQSRYVIFRGVDIQQRYKCTCPNGYANGIEVNDVCTKWFSLCYSKPCGSHGTCYPNDGGFSCVCEPGYSGKHCEINPTESSCPLYTPISLSTNPCHHGGVCNNIDPNGFSCTCPKNVETDGEFCTLSTRSFEKGSYIAVEGLRKRWDVMLTLEFATYESNAVLLYNSRYTNEKDFLSLEIVNGQVEFTVSLGVNSQTKKAKIHRVQSFVAGGVNDGKWNTVKIHYNNKLLKIAVGKNCDLETAHLVNPEGQHQYCSASKTIKDQMRSLDLTAPLHIGGLPNIGRPYKARSTDFIGCIRNVTVDHYKMDLANTIKSVNVTARCSLKKDFCALNNQCQNGGTCRNGLSDADCVCSDAFVGKRCEFDISSTSPSIKLSENSKILIDRTSKGVSTTSTVSLNVKTTTIDAVLIEEEIDNKQGFLKVSNGYPCYVFDSTVILNLTSLYISNGKWYQVELKWKDNWLFLSADHGRYSVKTYFDEKRASNFITKIGGSGDEQYIGCIKGFSVNDRFISLVSSLNQNVLPGCSKSSSCAAKENTCGKYGECQRVFGATECVCKSGFLGPQCQDICAKNPCMNGGTCKKVNVAESLSGFKCLCKDNFVGERCETEVTTECEDGFYKYEGGTCGPCPCKLEHHFFNATCDKGSRPGSKPGRCFCQDFYYRVGDMCAPCECRPEGLLSNDGRCDKETGQCQCKSNVIGRKCDQCHGVWEEVANNCMEINTSCPASYVEGIHWRRVPPGNTAVERCPSGTLGNATRYCHFRDSWQAPNLFGCITVGFHNVKTQIIMVTFSRKKGTSQDVHVKNQLHDITVTKPFITQVEAKDLAFQLFTATEETKNKRLYGADIEAGYKALELLIEYEGNQTAENLVSSDDRRFVSNIISSTSTLFHLDLLSFWTMIQEKYAGTAGLMREMEDFVEILALNFPYIKRTGGRIRRSAADALTPYSLAADRIYLEILPVTLNETNYNYELPKEQLKWASVKTAWKVRNIEAFVPSEMFEDDIRESGMEVGIAMVIYKTLGGLLPSVYDAEDREKGRSYTIDVYSEVFSLTIPKSYLKVPSKYSKPAEILIVYKHIKANTSAVSLTCAFWNYSLSGTISGGWSRKGCRTVLDNTTDVKCYCNHLTSFALIGVRYTEVMPRVYVPTIITYLAVILAIVLMFCVFLVYACLTQLKSNANSIHKNLAFVGVLAWAVFIALINRPSVGENFCRLIAIVLHYFMTCIFSWMFVEALHMYRMILEPRDINYGQMMFYYFIGWGAPLMVVGVTAGLKPEGYGSEEFCWISIRNYNEIMWVYLAPILAIIATNIIMVLAAFSSSCQTISSRGRKKNKIVTIRFRLAISMVYLPLLGAAVVTALITVSYDNMLFVYIFPGACVLQAIYLVLFYVFFNRKVRREAYNAYIRWKTGDKTFGIKQKRKPRQLLNHREKYRPMLQAFQVPTGTSTSDSSDTDGGRRRARLKMAGSDTTDMATTHMDSSDSSDDDSVRVRRPTIDSDSDSSENSFGGDQSQSSNGFIGHTPQKIEWKEATQKKLITKRTYASDGPMHSTPSETQSDTSGERQKWQKAFGGNSGLVAIPSESEDGMKYATRPAPRIDVQTHASTSSTTDSEAGSKDKTTPVSILKKKSSYDGNKRGKVRSVKVKKRDGSKKLLVSHDDTADFNDSQV